ncbi:uncharacterized protein LOC132169206 [Corylus avellana]|uniref:uncharacterized protein LOC132169206 n=1 Tax=Corylus avellana TaxID=13451 RepID=UPI00286C3B1C|nr:uncharacterized protein LOC132169206 [Corylus avellana]
MDACHLLLGRPWQYDQSIIYDGRRNTYTLSIKGKKVVLAPQRERVIHGPVIERGTNLLSISQFLEEAEEEGVVYALMPCEEGDNVDDEVSIELQEVLTEFADLMPENPPPGLPPMRDIQHHIDLMPGSSLPNRPAYHLSPKESEELQRQVTELLERGYI